MTTRRLSELEDVFGKTVAVYSKASGLEYATWNGSMVSTHAIDNSGSWENAKHLDAVYLGERDVAIAAVDHGSRRVVRAHWDADSTLGQTSSFVEADPVSALVLADYKLGVAGTECATISGGALHIRSEAGALLPLTGVPATTAHQVYRHAKGGANSADSFLYVAVSQQAGSQEAIREIFDGGTSLPIETNGGLVRNIVPNRPWSDWPLSLFPCVSVHMQDTSEVFRFGDIGATPNTQTLVPVPSWGAPGEQDYWRVPVSSDNDVYTPVPDGLATYADFDGDKLDDLLVASNSLAHFYVYPARDNLERANGMQITGFSTKSTSSGRRGGSALATTYTLDSTVDLGAVQGLSGPPTHVRCRLWVRNGLSNTIDMPLLSMVTVPVGTANTVPISISASTSYTAPDLIFYLQYRALIIDSSTGAVLEQSMPANCVAGTVPNSPDLCSLFSAEPDRYTAFNQSQNGCTSIAGPVILGGFNRRSTIGPFPAGYGSPVP